MSLQPGVVGSGGTSGTGDLTSTVGSYYEEVVGQIRVDGVLYDRKKRTIYCGNMPNATSKSIQTGLDSTNMTKILHIGGTFQTSTGNTFPIPYVVSSSITGQMGVNFDPSTGISKITTGANYSTYTGVITIEYY